MGINVVITGASGRMGKTLLGVIERHPELTLAGLVVHKPEDVCKNCRLPVGTDLKAVLKKVPDAVVVDFTSPAASLDFARIVAEMGAKQVIGTTGLNDVQRHELQRLAEQAAIIWSPNMSVGVNVLLKMLPQLVRSLGPDYDVEVVEIHHKKKKDSPSGTAVRLGEALADGKDWNYRDAACYHREGIIGERPQKQIGMQTVRGGDVVGVHTIYLLGPGERIEVNHQAHSRENFANGAMRAVKWIHEQKPGRLYSMLDII